MRLYINKYVATRPTAGTTGADEWIAVGVHLTPARGHRQAMDPYVAGRTGNGVGYAGYLATESTNTWSARARNLRADIGSFSQRDPAVDEVYFDATNIIVGSRKGSSALALVMKFGGPGVMGAHQMSKPGPPELRPEQLANLYQYVDSKPLVMLDPTGMIPIFTFAGGCVAGSVLAAAGRRLSCYVNGNVDCLRKVACAALGGCVTGGLFATGLGGCAAGGLGGTIRTACYNYASGRSFDLCQLFEIAVHTVSGCLARWFNIREEPIRQIFASAFPALITGGCVAYASKTSCP